MASTAGIRAWRLIELFGNNMFLNSSNEFDEPESECALRCIPAKRSLYSHFAVSGFVVQIA